MNTVKAFYNFDVTSSSIPGNRSPSPYYASEDARQQAMEKAIRREQDFLEFADRLQGLQGPSRDGDRVGYATGKSQLDLTVKNNNITYLEFMHGWNVDHRY